MVRQSDQRRKEILTAFAAIMALACAMLSGMEASASDKRIALSYDDGPMADGPLFSGVERTERLIQSLKDGGVDQAVFFMTTKNLIGEDEDHRVRDYARAGHLIANHSHSHSWLHQVGAQRYIDDLDMAERILTVYGNRRPWFRFPYLDEGRDIKTRDAVRAAMTARGLKNGYVTVDTFDWHMVDLVRKAKEAGRCVDLDKVGELYVGMFVAAAEHYHAIALESLGRAPAQVMLLHENDLAALFADDLAKGLRAAGWKIISADKAYQDPIAETEPDTLYLGQGRVAALAEIAGIAPERLRHDANSMEAINALFEAEGAVSACGAPTSAPENQTSNQPAD